MDIIALITQVAETNATLFAKVAQFAIDERAYKMAENHANRATQFNRAKWTFQVVTAQK